jgi:Kef-type K+ transport system membrane component KefB
MAAPALSALIPVIFLLAFGVLAVVASRAGRLSPIVGYLVLGLLIRATGGSILAENSTVGLLAELGVVFLLFDIGLHFSLTHVRRQAKDIFGFGPVQILFGAVLLGLLAFVTGLAPLPAFFLGAVLALSSTAVVAPLIAERHQQSCPVGLTATAILVFQDVAAIFLLIIAGALGGGSILPIAVFALIKAAAAFVLAVIFARLIVKPLFKLVAHTGQEEVFTAMALLVALSTAWATGQIGLSLTLGAFLGGMAVAETPYRAIIQSEVKPFRGLLLGFFFISVGLSLDVGPLLHLWPVVIGISFALIATKVLSNAAASLVFRWSVPGSLQLGFLLAQGSEFAFVVLSLPAVRTMIGPVRVSIVVAAVALSLALTPNVAQIGRRMAGQLRRRRERLNDPELELKELAAPVLIIGMGRIGRTLADGLDEFSVRYSAVERDQRRLSEAIADGYIAMYGDMTDPRLWNSIASHGRRINAWTGVSYETAREFIPFSQSLYPNLQRFAAVTHEEEAGLFELLGVRAVVDRSLPPGLDFTAAVLSALGINVEAIDEWMRHQQERALAANEPTSAVA